MLRATELSAMRGCVNRAFPDKCDILTNQGTDNGLGQMTDHWIVATPATDSNLGCRVMPLTGTSERDVADQTTATAESTILLPYFAPVTAAQRVRVKSTQAVYEVVYCHPVGAEDLSRFVDGKIVG